MQLLIDKELNSDDKILKPDFNCKTGRELLAFYLQTKFKQILAYDKRCSSPVFVGLHHDFIARFSKRLINKPSKRFLIGITGESASGKSTICKEIKHIIEQFEMPVSILSTDNYFNDISALIDKYNGFDNLIENGFDIDSPKSFQLDVLSRDLQDLADGLDVKVPMYLPNGTGVSIPNSLEIKSEKIIVVEGIATMYEDIKDVFDIKIYIEADNEVRKTRFLKRAKEERNQNNDNALKQWQYLVNAGEKYVIPNRREADFVINGNSDLNYFAQILEYIYTITNNFQ